MSKHAGEEPLDRKAEVEKLWETVRSAVKRLDELADEEAIEEGELYPEDIPDGQVLGTCVIAYTITYVDEFGEACFVPTYMIPPGVGPDTALGAYEMAAMHVKQDIRDAMQD